MIITQVHKIFRHSVDESEDNIIYLSYTTKSKILRTSKWHVIHLPATKKNILELIKHDRESIKTYVHEKYVNTWSRKVTGVKIKHSIMYDIEHTFTNSFSYGGVNYDFLVVGHRNDLKSGMPKKICDDVVVINSGDGFIGPAWNYYTNNIKFIHWLKLTKRMDYKQIDFIVLTHNAMEYYEI